MGTGAGASRNFSREKFYFGLAIKPLDVTLSSASRFGGRRLKVRAGSVTRFSARRGCPREAPPPADDSRRPSSSTDVDSVETVYVSK